MAYPILIVDDEPQIRGLIRFLLSEQGLATLEAPDGAAALGIVQGNAGKISVLLTDIHMHKMNGIELAQAVSQAFPAIPIILMSAFPAEMLVREVPGRAFLQKPFLPAVLIGAVNEALANGCARAGCTPEAPKEVRNSGAQAPAVGLERFVIPGKFRATNADEHPPA
jgi:CheY-like chemotaxis protein